MSISFSATNVNRIRVLAEWHETSTAARPCPVASEFTNRWYEYGCAIRRYRMGDCRLSELRKRHRELCDFLEATARSYPSIDAFWP